MTRAAFEPINPNTNYSFAVRKFEQKEFTSPYHFHPEYELTLIVKGEGNRYVGNSMAVYSTGDLVLLGENLPHCWKTSAGKSEALNASSVVVQFNKDFLGNGFFSKPEMATILQLLERSVHGIQFLNETVGDITAQMLKLSEEEEPFEKLISMLKILQTLATSKEFVLLHQKGMMIEKSAVKQERINRVLGYIVDHFKDEILLEKASEIAHMSPNAFCKYYKKVTGQTFMETVIDYRINYAIQQLIHSDKSISDISFESGFVDVSHFYKLFKRKIKLSPLNYRKKFIKDI